MARSSYDEGFARLSLVLFEFSQFLWLQIGHESLVITAASSASKPLFISSGRKLDKTTPSSKQRRAAIPTRQALCGIPNVNSSQTGKTSKP